MKTHCITINRSGSTTKKILNNGTITTHQTVHNKEYLKTVATDDYLIITITDPNTGDQIERYYIDLIK